MLHFFLEMPLRPDVILSAAVEDAVILLIFTATGALALIAYRSLASAGAPARTATLSDTSPISQSPTHARSLPLAPPRNLHARSPTAFSPFTRAERPRPEENEATVPSAAKMTQPPPTVEQLEAHRARWGPSPEELAAEWEAERRAEWFAAEAEALTAAMEEEMEKKAAIEAALEAVMVKSESTVSEASGTGADVSVRGSEKGTDGVREAEGLAAARRVRDSGDAGTDEIQACRRVLKCRMSKTRLRR